MGLNDLNQFPHPRPPPEESCGRMPPCLAVSAGRADFPRPAPFQFQTVSARYSPKRLTAVRRAPTNVRRESAFTRFAIHAPKGAAQTPPISRPNVAVVNASQPSVARKVAEIVTVRKNSAVLTVPMVFRGLLPWTSRLEVTMPPQPPPPAASRKPPRRPRGETIRGRR